MSESQVLSKIVPPAIKVSSLDGHRIVSRPGGGPVRDGGQPSRAESQDVVIKHRAPLDVQMTAGGVTIKHPAGHTHESRGIAGAGHDGSGGGAIGKRVPLTHNANIPQRGRAVVTAPASPFSRDEIVFLGGLVSNAAQSLAGAQLEIATATLEKLSKLHETSK